MQDDLERTLRVVVPQYYGRHDTQLAEGGRAMAQKENELGLAIMNTEATSGNNYQGYGLTQAAGTSGVLAYTGIVKAIGQLRGQNAFPDTLVVNQTEEASILQDQNFTSRINLGILRYLAICAIVND